MGVALCYVLRVKIHATRAIWLRGFGRDTHWHGTIYLHEGRSNLKCEKSALPLSLVSPVTTRATGRRHSARLTIYNWSAHARTRTQARTRADASRTTAGVSLRTCWPQPPGAPRGSRVRLQRHQCGLVRRRRETLRSFTTDLGSINVDHGRVMNWKNSPPEMHYTITA